MRRFIAVLALVSFTLSTLSAAPPQSNDDKPLTGYTRENSQSQRQWEKNFAPFPIPAGSAANMQRLSARPHHVGSPYDKDNAEWMLAQFKEWGLDAQIETFDVLFPTPKERVLELVAPTHFTRQARGAGRRRRSHVQPAERAAADLQRLLDRRRRHRRRWST